MRKFGQLIAKHRVLVLVLAALLLVPSLYGMVATRVNYDMLVYLPKTFDTMVGQDILKDDFDIGSFCMVIVENMDDRDIVALKDKIAHVDHVKKVLWYDDVADIAIPREALPSELYSKFNRDDATYMVVFFDTGTSEDGTIEATREIRSLSGKQCFVAGMSALVVDLKDMCEKEEPIYVALAVICATVAMQLLLDSWLIPFVFLACIGIAVLYNLGTDFFFGQISYITKALAAVLQLAVTMDYSIFLWQSYVGLREKMPSHEEAMAEAISQTFIAVLGSSLTTIAGFLTFCAMSFTLGFDLGIVMAKGVFFGLICALTTLPAMILALDKPLEKTRHRTLLPDMKGTAAWIVKHTVPLLIIFALLIVPAYIGYRGANDGVYYDMGAVMPKEIDYVVANTKLKDEFDISSSYLVMTSASIPDTDARKMLDEISAVDGVQVAIGMESVVGPMIPEEMIPSSIEAYLKSDNWKLYLVSTSYHPSSDEINAELDTVQKIVKSHDAKGMLVGEAPLTKDMIEVTNTDFQVVTILSIAAIFIIILLSEKSLSIPVILVSVIEFAIFINLGIAWYTGKSLAFWARSASARFSLVPPWTTRSCSAPSIRSTGFSKIKSRPSLRRWPSRCLR